MKDLFNRMVQWKRQWDYSASILKAAKSGIAIENISSGIDIFSAKVFHIASQLHRASPQTRKIFTEQLLNVATNTGSPQTVEDFLDIMAQTIAEATAEIDTLNDPAEYKNLQKITDAVMRLEDWIENQDERLLPVLDSFVRWQSVLDILTSMAPKGNYEVTVKGKPQTIHIPESPAGP